MTIIVPTFRRCEAVLRLLRAFAEQLEGPQGAGVEILVVVDDSRDGTLEAVQELDYPVALRAIYQENAGIAVTRNRGLAEVTTDLTWFVDDDMVPGEGLVQHHRMAHVAGERRLLMGPCLHPPDAPIAEPIRAYAERWFSQLAAEGAITRAFDFSAANTSGPTAVWREVGGFFEDLRGWGGEDFEIGLRLLQAGIPITYDSDAVAWHLQDRSVRAFCANRVDQGRNLVRIVRLHPDTLDELIPRRAAGRVLRAVHRASAGHPRRYLAASRALALAATAEGALSHGRASALLALADTASQIAGVADLDEDGTLVARYFDGP